MRIMKFLLAFTVAFVFISPVRCSAEIGENYQFVDSRNDTGYYVDMKSVSVGENGHEYTVDIAVVKGDSNKVYQYRISLDYGERTYFIHKAVIRTYDTGKVISDEVNDGLAHPYGTMSPMQYIVDYIYAVEHGNKNP